MNDLALIVLAFLAFVGLMAVCILISKGIRRSRMAETRLILSTIFYNNQKFQGEITMAQIKVLQLLAGALALVNHKDNSPIEAKFANETFSSSDTAIATVSVDPQDGQDTAILDVTGVAEGEADILIEVDATYVDPNTNEQVTHHKTTTVHFVVTKPVDEAETDLVVTFALPQAPPAGEPTV